MTGPGTSGGVRERLVEALRLDLVGPGAGHPFADERLPGWVRPSNWYLTGLPDPLGHAPREERRCGRGRRFRAGARDSAGLAEESSEERKAAKKGYFPSSMGLSFLVPAGVHEVEVVVRWGDYAPAEIEDRDGKPVPIWQRTPHEETVALRLRGTAESSVRDVPGSGGLQLHVVERAIDAEDLAPLIPAGTRSVSVFLVNHRAPDR